MTNYMHVNRQRRDICWLCGGKLIWGCDYDPEDYDYEGNGIVATLHCSSCKADVTYVQIDEEE